MSSPAAAASFYGALPFANLLNSSAAFGWQQLFAVSFRCDIDTEALVVPARPDNLLIVQTDGHTAIRAHVERPFHQPHSLPGELFLVPQGLATEWSIQGRCEVLHLCLPPKLLASTALEGFDLDPARVELLPSPGFRDPLLYAIANALNLELRAAGPLGPIYADTLAQALVVHLLHHYAALPRALPIQARGLGTTELQRVLEYIDAHLAQTLSLAELAAVVHLSPYHFARTFTRAVGMAPHHYVIAQRVAAAERLLRDPKLTLKEIARQVGFADQSHLTRHFKRLRGAPPRAYYQQGKNVQSAGRNIQDEPPSEQ